MKKLILIFFISTLFVQASAPTMQSSVYICTGPGSAKYHSSNNCRGLQKCNHTVKSITKASAQSSGYTACKICY